MSKWDTLSKHLEANGKRAPATVVEVSRSGVEVEKGGFLGMIGLSSGDRYDIRRTTLLIRPDGEPEFEVSPKIKYEEYGVPDAGDEIDVLYDPDDHEQVMPAPPKPVEYDPSKGLGETKVGFTLDLSRFRKKK